MKPLHALLVSGLALALLAGPTAAQQGMPAAKQSPHSSVTQGVGLAQVSIDYHRPGVRGRAIWGGLIPYGEVWRVGANENTVVTFSDDVIVEGQPLPAGNYGLHAIPGAERWTVIFSNNSTSWGSYSYTPEEDALRVEVAPVEHAFTEWLTIGLEPRDDASSWLTIDWADVRVPVVVATDLQAAILEKTRSEYLRGLNKWNPQAWQQAAQFCLDNGVNLEEAVGWAREAARMNRNFTTVSLQAQLLDALGQADEAKTLKAQAWSVATEPELIQMGAQLMAASQYPDAVRIFELNVRSHPDSWKAHDHLGEAYAKAGDAEKARACYGRALDLAQDSGTRQRIEKQIQALGS